MTDRFRHLDGIAAADRRIARAEELVARLLKLVLALDPASTAAATGWRSLHIMHATLVQFQSTREQFLRSLSNEQPSPEAVIPLLADDSGADANKDVRMPPTLDWEQGFVLRALLKLESRADSPGEFDSLWMCALQNDFRPEKETNGPLRTALKL